MHCNKNNKKNNNNKKNKTVTIMLDQHHEVTKVLSPAAPAVAKEQEEDDVSNTAKAATGGGEGGCPFTKLQKKFEEQQQKQQEQQQQEKETEGGGVGGGCPFTKLQMKFEEQQEHEQEEEEEEEIPTTHETESTVSLTTTTSSTTNNNNAEVVEDTLSEAFKIVSITCNDENNKYEKHELETLLNSFFHHSTNIGTNNNNNKTIISTNNNDDASSEQNDAAEEEEEQRNYNSCDDEEEEEPGDTLIAQYHQQTEICKAEETAVAEEEIAAAAAAAAAAETSTTNIENHEPVEIVIPTTKNKIMERKETIKKTPSASNLFLKENEKMSTAIKKSKTEAEEEEEEFTIEKKLFLLDTISSVQRQYLQSEGPRATFGCLLEKVLELMESEYGFIGEIKFEDAPTDLQGNHQDQGAKEKKGRMFLQTHAITNIAWNSATRTFYDDNIESGLKFTNLNSLFGTVMTTSKPVISNSPSTDKRGCGVPKGHPALNCFLGIPFFRKEGEMNGMVGIANKPGGYTQKDIDFLEPFIITCGNLIHAYLQKEHNKELINNLEQKVKERTRELELLNTHLEAANRRISISAKTERELLQKNLRQSDELLLNMLPPEIATRLKTDPQHIADHHDNVTILFADLVGFTEMSSSMSPISLVSFLNDLFSRFDSLVDIYELNKVKTIGDCYMVTSIPTSTSISNSNKDNDLEACINTCHLAFDMIENIKAFNNKCHPDKKLEIRIGINVGPVVAGVIGTSRFLYDLWGDTVNVASRMESLGMASQIQVTQNVVDYVSPTTPDDFKFDYRGKIDVKGKGLMSTYWLKEA